MVMDEKGLARLLRGLKGIFEKVINNQITCVENFMLTKDVAVLNCGTYDKDTDTIYMSEECTYDSENDIVVFKK